jgi:hypothetical protein
MDKIIKILFAVILVFVAFLWLSTLFKSCNKPKSIIGNLPVEENSENIPNDEFFTTNEDLIDTASYFDFEETGSEKNIYDEIDKIAEDRQKIEEVKKDNSPSATASEINKTEEVKTQNNNTKNENPIGGKYLIITGSFLLEKNADDFVQKLKKSGFSGAEKVVFDNSEYFSTIAGRRNDYKQATELVEKLKQNGFKDCRIKEKK